MVFTLILKDDCFPFFQASFVYVFVRFAETVTYSYLALYLTDYLHFEKVRHTVINPEITNC